MPRYGTAKFWQRLRHVSFETAAQHSVCELWSGRFINYCQLLQDDLMPRYGETEHYAVIELRTAWT